MTEGGNFGEILDEYLRALKAGNAPDREVLLATHADIAGELQTALLGIDFVHSAAPRFAPEEDADTQPGRSLGDYRLLRELGRGGMAVVYEAEQVSLGRHVALKVLPFAAVLEPKHLQRFKNEAMAAAHLRHKNIVPVYSVGCERGVHYYAMQYIEGQSLATVIREMKGGDAGEGAGDPAGPRTPISSHGSNREPAYIRMATVLGVQAAEALDHAHELGIVHRDVKPGNLLVDLAGTLWITDFGLASSRQDVSLTMTGELLGTVRYMSPEQALAKRVPVDHRTDVYSLGATLYELFTLEPAFPGNDAHLVIQDIASKEPVLPRRLNPVLPRDLETVILKAMAKDPAGRYATAQELADDLDRILNNRPIEAKRPGPFRRASKWGRRHRAFVGATAAVLLLAVAGLATGAALLWREKEHTTTAFERAEANLALALKALDRIYLDEAEGHPKIRSGLPRDLLEQGLGFYEQFARENAHNDAVARLMGNAYYRVSLLFEALGQGDRKKVALDRAISIYRDVVQKRPQDWGAHNNLGNALWYRGDLADAILALREAIRLNPDLAMAHSNLGNALRDKGDLGGAIEEHRKALRLKPDDANAHCSVGIALSENGDSADAIAEFRHAIRLEPDNANAHYSLGLVLSGTGNLDGAILEYREAIRLEPDLPKAHDNLGNSLAATGHLDDAIQEYREAIRLRPDLPNAHDNLGLALRESGKVDAAIQEHREAIRLKPDSVKPHDHLGVALTEKGDLDAAIREHREALRLDPGYANAYCNLGSALDSKGDPDAAIAAYRSAIRLRPDFAEAHSNLGHALGAKGDPEGAMAAYREAIRLKPDLAKAHSSLGDALSDLGRSNEALAAYEEAIKIDPRRAADRIRRGVVLCDHLGRPGEALEEFDRAIGLEPQSAAAHANRAIALRNLGRFEDALAASNRAIEIDGQYAVAHAARGSTLCELRRLEEAIVAFDRAIAINPRYAQAHNSRGSALRDLGRLEDALAAFDRAIEIDPQDAQSHYNRGNALRAKGEGEAAIAAYQVAIRLRPDFAEAHCNLGHALVNETRFSEALPWLRKGHELGSKRSDWVYPSKQWVHSAERQAGVKARLERVLTGEGSPRDALERIEFALLLYRMARHAESARMYAEAFTQDASLSEDVAQGHRYNAACSAALASARGGADAAEWRRRTLEWLRADLAAWEQAVTCLPDVLEHWKQDPDLAAVRDNRDELPEPEREAWRSLWAAVDRALSAAHPAAK